MEQAEDNVSGVGSVESKIFQQWAVYQLGSCHIEEQERDLNCLRSKSGNRKQVETFIGIS